jgi:hypothetical protein
MSDARASATLPPGTMPFLDCRTGRVQAFVHVVLALLHLDLGRAVEAITATPPAVDLGQCGTPLYLASGIVRKIAPLKLSLR